MADLQNINPIQSKPSLQSKAQGDSARAEHNKRYKKENLNFTTHPNKFKICAFKLSPKRLPNNEIFDTVEQIKHCILIVAGSEFGMSDKLKNINEIKGIAH